MLQPVSASAYSFGTLSEALDLYLRLKGVGKDRVFHRGDIKLDCETPHIDL